MNILKLFKTERYPSYPEEFEDPNNYVFREFYLRSSPDFAILYRLVKEHFPDRGNDRITKARLLFLLQDSENRTAYLGHKRHNYPRTWRIRWWCQCFKRTIHRRLRTQYFKNQVELCNIAKEVVRDFDKNHPENKL